MSRNKWKIDPKRKVIFLEKNDKWSRFQHFFGIPKQSVSSFYSGLMEKFASVEMMQYSIPVKAEGSINSEFRKPRYFLVNGWTIAKKDIKHLKKGPLTDEDGNNLFVDEYSGWQKIKKQIKEFGPLVFDIIMKFFGK